MKNIGSSISHAFLRRRLIYIAVVIGGLFLTFPGDCFAQQCSQDLSCPCQPNLGCVTEGFKDSCVDRHRLTSTPINSSKNDNECRVDIEIEMDLLIDDCSPNGGEILKPASDAYVNIHKKTKENVDYFGTFKVGPIPSGRKYIGPEVGGWGQLRTHTSASENPSRFGSCDEYGENCQSLLIPDEWRKSGEYYVEIDMRKNYRGEDQYNSGADRIELCEFLEKMGVSDCECDLEPGCHPAEIYKGFAVRKEYEDGEGPQIGIRLLRKPTAMHNEFADIEWDVVLEQFDNLAPVKIFDIAISQSKQTMWLLTGLARAGYSIVRSYGLARVDIKDPNNPRIIDHSEVSSQARGNLMKTSCDGPLAGVWRRDKNLFFEDDAIYQVDNTEIRADEGRPCWDNPDIPCRFYDAITLQKLNPGEDQWTTVVLRDGIQNLDEKWTVLDTDQESWPYILVKRFQREIEEPLRPIHCPGEGYCDYADESAPCYRAVKKWKLIVALGRVDPASGNLTIVRNLEERTYESEPYDHYRLRLLNAQTSPWIHKTPSSWANSLYIECEPFRGITDYQNGIAPPAHRFPDGSQSNCTNEKHRCGTLRQPGWEGGGDCSVQRFIEWEYRAHLFSSYFPCEGPFCEWYWPIYGDWEVTSFEEAHTCEETITPRPSCRIGRPVQDEEICQPNRGTRPGAKNCRIGNCWIDSKVDYWEKVGPNECRGNTPLFEPGTSCHDFVQSSFEGTFDKIRGDWSQCAFVTDCWSGTKCPNSDFSNCRQKEVIQGESCPNGVPGIEEEVTQEHFNIRPRDRQAVSLDFSYDPYSDKAAYILRLVPSYKVIFNPTYTEEVYKLCHPQVEIETCKDTIVEREMADLEGVTLDPETGCPLTEVNSPGSVPYTPFTKEEVDTYNGIAWNTYSQPGSGGEWSHFYDPENSELIVEYEIEGTQARIRCTYQDGCHDSLTDEVVISPSFVRDNFRDRAGLQYLVNEIQGLHLTSYMPFSYVYSIPIDGHKEYFEDGREHYELGPHKPLVQLEKMPRNDNYLAVTRKKEDGLNRLQGLDSTGNQKFEHKVILNSELGIYSERTQPCSLCDSECDPKYIGLQFRYSEAEPDIFYVPNVLYPESAMILPKDSKITEITRWGGPSTSILTHESKKGAPLASSTGMSDYDYCTAIGDISGSFFIPYYKEDQAKEGRAFAVTCSFAEKYLQISPHETRSSDPWMPSKEHLELTERSKCDDVSYPPSENEPDTELPLLNFEKESEASRSAQDFAESTNIEQVGRVISLRPAQKQSKDAPAMINNKPMPNPLALNINITPKSDFQSVAKLNSQVTPGKITDKKFQIELQVPSKLSFPHLYRKITSTDWESIPDQTWNGITLSGSLGHYGYYQVFDGTPSEQQPSPPGRPQLPHEQPFSFGEVYVFPNPIKIGQIPTLHIGVKKADNLSVRVYEVTGNLVYESRVDNNPVNVDGKPAFHHTMAPKLFNSGTYLGMVTAEKAGEKNIRQRFRFSVVK